MKTKEIKYLNAKELSELSIELFVFIETVYGIGRPDSGFEAYFAKRLKKNYSFLTFEQLHDAFERNAYQYLDNYLPRIGFRADNKISKFTIPDLTKIINAYCRYLGLQKTEKKLAVAPATDEEKQQIRDEWCDQLIDYFTKYFEKSERSVIRLPYHTCLVLHKIGLLEMDEINASERRINIEFKGKRRSRFANEDLVYQVFDRLIANGESLESYLQSFRYIKNKMPF